MRPSPTGVRRGFPVLRPVVSSGSYPGGADDWVQYVIDRPMAEEPGKVFNYSSGATELLAYIFPKETGQEDVHF